MLVSRQAATQPGPSDAGLERSNRLNQSVRQSLIQSFNCAEQWTCRRAYLSPQVLFFANVKLALFSSLSVCVDIVQSLVVLCISYQIIITRFFTRMFAPFPCMSITYHLVFRSTTAGQAPLGDQFNPTSSLLATAVYPITNARSLTAQRLLRWQWCGWEASTEESGIGKLYGTQSNSYLCLIGVTISNNNNQKQQQWNYTAFVIMVFFRSQPERLSPDSQAMETLSRVCV